MKKHKKKTELEKFKLYFEEIPNSNKRIIELIKRKLQNA